MRKKRFVCLIIAFLVAKGACVETSEFDAVIEHLVLSEEFSDGDRRRLDELPRSVIPILTSRLAAADSPLYQSRLYYCLAYKVKQHQKQLGGAIMTAAIDALVGKCQGSEAVVIPRLRLLTGIRHDKIRSLADSLANDSHPKVREAAHALKAANQ